MHLARRGHAPTLWGRDPGVVAEMSARRANAVYLPDTVLPDGVRVTSVLGDVVPGATIIVVAVPTHGVRNMLKQVAPLLAERAIVVSATKGLESDTHYRVSEIIVQELGAVRLGVLSGPSFAAEVVRELPTAVSVASADAGVVETLLAEFRAPYFRLYGTTDVVGVEIGGAMKNVIAIAAGAAEGLGLGHNALAGLITRGLVEIARLACAAGAQRETMAGLTGLGDLVLTCTGALSRNRHVGMELARGRSLHDVLAGMKMVAEGVRTTEAALGLGQKYGVELPITSQVAALLAGRTDARSALYDLMLRPQRSEVG